MKQPIATICLVWLGLLCSAGAQSPFSSEAQLMTTPEGGEQLQVTIKVPPEHHLYANMMKVVAEEPTGVKLTPVNPPKPKLKYDETFGKEVGTFTSTVRLTYSVAGRDGKPLKVVVSYQGCSDSTCFLPQDDTFVLSEAKGIAKAEAPTAGSTPASGISGGNLDDLAKRYRIGGSAVGYMAPGEFLSFLDEAKAGTVTKEEDEIVQRVFRRFGLLAVMVLLIPLGFLLNLTPCVLPMIPINLAIIGAGSQSGSRKRGFALGGVYGAGMAAVYGVLGLVVVLTGQQFGALNASPWFNLAIAVLFVALALAMFDVFLIDLSRFQRRSSGGDDSKAPFVAAFLFGGTAALLAGACVAPVLISVLVLATNLYRTNPAALLLPFMLGVGMASPWPFAGAGMSFLPKPGAWMDRVKHVFGVLILLAALYYGWLAVQQFRAADGGHKKTDVAAALEQGLKEGKPVLFDFWALSCKACKEMDKKVFPDPDVRKKLEGFVFSGVQMDLAERDDVRWAKDYFHIQGMPTYVVLVPVGPANGE
jgi:thiol:disulfide interchange protein